MPVFEYNAKSAGGSIIKGRMEAADEASVNASLRRKDYYPIMIRPYNESSVIDFNKLKMVTIKDISIFCRQFSVIINSGMSIIKGLSIVAEQTENKKLKSVLTGVYQDVQKGKSLSTAMEKYDEFPNMLINMIRVGEVSGTLDMIMSRMASYYEKEYKLKQKIKQSLTYPCVVCIFSIVVVMFLVIKVLPTFTGMLKDMGQKELPLPTRIVLGFSNLLMTKGILVLALTIAVIFLIRLYIKSPQGKKSWDSFKFRAVLFGKLNKKIATSQFARTFGILMASGVPLIESLTVCADVIDNEVIRKILDDAREKIKKGTGIADTLSSSGFFPPMLTNMIKVGEESGNLDEVLKSTAEFYDGEVESATAQMTTLIEPIMIIVLSVVVGFIIISVILPIFNMYNAVGNM